MKKYLFSVMAIISTAGAFGFEAGEVERKIAGIEGPITEIQFAGFVTPSHANRLKMDIANVRTLLKNLQGQISERVINNFNIKLNNLLSTLNSIQLMEDRTSPRIRRGY